MRGSCWSALSQNNDSKLVTSSQETATSLYVAMSLRPVCFVICVWLFLMPFTDHLVVFYTVIRNH